MIKYLGTKKDSAGGILYVFLVNGLEKQLRESALKQHPGCWDVLPPAAKAQINAHRQWLSKL